MVQCITSPPIIFLLEWSAANPQDKWDLVQFMSQSLTNVQNFKCNYMYNLSFCSFASIYVPVMLLEAIFSFRLYLTVLMHLIINNTWHLGKHGHLPTFSDPHPQNRGDIFDGIYLCLHWLAPPLDTWGMTIWRSRPQIQYISYSSKSISDPLWCGHKAREQAIWPTKFTLTLSDHLY